MLDLKGRSKFDVVTGPVGQALARTGISETALTTLGLVVTIIGAGMLAAGWLVAGAAVAGLGVLFDAFDGPLARARGTASRHGAFMDTMSDRFGEIAVYGGTVVHLVDDPAAVLLIFFGTAMALLTPYVRAKAEAWGGEGRGGVMGRAERMILFLVGVGLAGFDLPTLYPMLWVFAVLTSVTVAMRVYRTWFQLTSE